MKSVLAADLGGTKCRFALVAEDCSVHRVEQIATIRERGAFLAEMDRAVAAVLATPATGLEPPLAFGVGTAGVIPPEGGVVRYAPNLPLHEHPLAEHLRGRTGLPVTLINDGRASAWGEWLRGHARGADPLLCLFFGTGIGIGLMVGGRPYGGFRNAAGEIGHTIHVPGGRRCPCGRDGHFEAYCGGRAITERAAERCGPGPRDGRWRVGDVVAAAAGGNQDAAAILAEAEAAATALVANACILLNPAAVVLGGGVLDGWPALRASIEAGVQRLCSVPVLEGLRFAPSLGGSDAILWGAAAATGALWRS